MSCPQMDGRRLEARQRGLDLMTTGSALVRPLCATLADATALSLIPALALIQIGKTIENAVDYSINNTARQLPPLVR